MMRKLYFHAFLILFTGVLFAQITVIPLSDPAGLLTLPEAEIFNRSALSAVPGTESGIRGTLSCTVNEISTRTEDGLIGVELLLSCSFFDSTTGSEGEILFQDNAMPALGVGFDRFESLTSAAEDFHKQIKALFRTLPGAPGGGLLTMLGSTYVIPAAAFPAIGPGDEMAALGNESSGLLLIKERFGSAVFAVPVYGDPSGAAAFTPLSRAGLDTDFYGGLFISSDGNITPLTGLRARATLGSARMYPLLGVELMTGRSVFSGGDIIFPYLGLQYVWYFGRFTVSPMGAFGVGSFINGSEAMRLSYAGGYGGLEVLFRGGKNFALFLNGGYGSWIDLNGIADDGSYGYNGVRAVGGFRWKF